MANQPKIILLLSLILIILSTSSALTKKTNSSNRTDFLDDNSFVYNFENDINHIPIIDPIIRINNRYIDNNSKLINNNFISQEIKSLPNPIIIEK